MSAESLKERLRISTNRLEEINALLLDSDGRAIQDFLGVVAKYGTPEEINAKAANAGKLENLLCRLEKEKSPYLADIKWLIAQRDARAFVSLPEYQKTVVGERAKR